MHKYRTHTCSKITKKDSGATVKLSGWIHRKRDHGNLLFFDLRDHFGLTQCVIENLDEKTSENLLFTLMNIALQDNKYILLTSIEPINVYKFKLLDLQSRVNSCISIGIKLPSDDLISVILSKRFSDKQILVEKNHIDYIVKRIDRSYEKISQFILTLDKYSLKKGSPFGLKLIKEVLNMI